MTAATEYTGRNRRKKDDQLELLLEEVSTRTVNKLNPQHPCRFAHISPDEHERHHRMCESAIEFLDRLNNTKWGILKAVAIFIVLGGLSLFAAGVSLKFGGHQ
ncbi:MAG: hypothetical protein KKD63_16865 [Proteobacteria bacterium]|nr:hypothetical protein [Desulfobulbaceae bacterium]MBU4154544.1 hypothetical protein [Pseudomonadota bacterium]